MFILEFRDFVPFCSLRSARPKLKMTQQAGPKSDDDWSSLDYCSGFANHHRTEAVPGALPVGQNSPQVPPLGLYAEQVWSLQIEHAPAAASAVPTRRDAIVNPTAQVQGSAFTCPRPTNTRSWLYRIAPSVCQGGYAPAATNTSAPSRLCAAFPVIDPSPMRWRPLPLPAGAIDFVQGLTSYCGAGKTHCTCGKGGRFTSPLSAIATATATATATAIAIAIATATRRQPIALALSPSPRWAAAQGGRGYTSLRLQRTDGRPCLLQCGRRLAHCASAGWPVRHHRVRADASGCERDLRHPAQCSLRRLAHELQRGRMQRVRTGGVLGPLQASRPRSHRGERACGAARFPLSDGVVRRPGVRLHDHHEDDGEAI